MYVLNERVTLRDERHYLDAGLCILSDTSCGKIEYLQVAAFELLKAWTYAMGVDEAWNVYSQHCDRLRETPADRIEFNSFVDEMIRDGQLEAAAAGTEHRRPLTPLTFPIPSGSVQKPLRFPSQVSVGVTSRCNLSCLHCLRESGPFARPEDEWTTEELVDLLHQLDLGGAISVALTGGETTVRGDSPRLLEEAAGLRPHLEYFTNAYVLREPVIEAIVATQRLKGRGFHVHLSLDGASQATHDWLRGPSSYVRTLTALRRLASLGVVCVVESMLTPRSIGEIDDTAALVADAGGLALSFHPTSRTGRASRNPVALDLADVLRAQRRAEELAAEYAGRLKIEFSSHFVPNPREKSEGEVPLPPNAAAAGMYHLALGSDAWVYPCVEVVGVLRLRIGSMRKRRLAEIWRSRHWDLYRGGWDLSQLRECRGCKFDGRCSIQGCRCYALASFGDAYAALPECYASAAELWGQEREGRRRTSLWAGPEAIRARELISHRFVSR